MFQGDLINQFRLWLSIGIITILPTTFIFGFLLRCICKLYLKIEILYKRAFFIQFLGMFFCWLSIFFFAALSQFGGHKSIWITVTGVSSIFITAIFYSRMIKGIDSEPIGYISGLKLSSIVTLIAILIKIPVEMINKIIT